MAAIIPVKVIIDAVDNASKKLGSLGKNIEGLGKSFVKLGAAPAAAMALSVKSAIDFEDAFAGVRKTVNASESEFAQLSDNIRGIAKVAPVSTTELAEIGEMAGQLGVSGVDDLTKFIDTISKMSVTTNLTGEQAATSFARIANVMSEPIENVDKMGSTVVALGNNFATTESEITEFASRIAGAGKIAGLIPSQVFAIGAAMSSVGVQAEAGGTAVQKMLLSMNQAVIEGGSDLSTFAQTAGMSASEFKETWEEDAMAGFTHFVEGLGREGDNAINVLDDLGMADQRLIRSFLSLANAGELLNDTYNTSAKAWMENNALAEEAAKRYETTKSQIQILVNNLKDIGITIGSTVLPAFNDMLDAIKPILESFSTFATEHPKLVAGFLGIGTALFAIGTAMVVLGPIVSALGTAFGFLGTILGVGGGGGGILGVLGTIVGFLGGPLTIAIIAIAGLVALFAAAWKNNWFGIQEIFTNVMTIIQEAWAQFQLALQLLMEYILALPEKFMAWVESMKATIYNFFINELPFAIGYLIGRLIYLVTNVVPNAVMNFIKWIINLRTTVPNLLNQMKQKATEFITQMVKQAIQLAIEMFNAVVQWVTNLLTNVQSILSNLPGVVSQFFESAKQKAIGKAKELFEGVKAWFDKVLDIVNSIISAIGDAIGKVREGLSMGLSGRQYGGPVSAASPVMVGESGPEVFVPSTAGHIVPNHQVAAAGAGAGGGTVQFIINANTIINSPQERRNLAEALYTDLVKLARAQNTTVAEMMGG